MRRLYPRNWVATVGLAALHAGGNDPDGARQLLDEALQLGGEDARTFAKTFPALEGLLGG